MLLDPFFAFAVLMASTFGLPLPPAALKLSGTILSPNGDPQSGVVITTQISRYPILSGPSDDASERIQLEAGTASVSDAAGAFQILIHPRYLNKSIALIAFHRAHSWAQIVTVDNFRPTVDLKIRLEQAVSVEGMIDFAELPWSQRFPDLVSADVRLPNKWLIASLAVYVDGIPISLTKPQVRQARFEVLLPPGKFRFTLRNEHSLTEQLDVQLPRGLERFDLGNIALKVRPGATLIGSGYPRIELSDTLGVQKDDPLQDLIGKWIVIEFWDDDSRAMFLQSLPLLKKLYLQHCSDNNAQAAIIAIHSSRDVRTKNESGQVKPIGVDRVWNGESLPFSLLIDVQGRAANDWGVQTFPTTFLIDPEGRVHAIGSTDKIVRRVNRILRARARVLRARARARNRGAR